MKKKGLLTISASRSAIAEIKSFTLHRKVLGFLTLISVHITFYFGYTFLKSRVHNKCLGSPPYGTCDVITNLLHNDKTTTAANPKNSRNLLSSTTQTLTVEEYLPQISLASLINISNLILQWGKDFVLESVNKN